MNITINLLEVASELAHEVVCAKFEDDESAIYHSTTDTTTSYTEKAQELFEKHGFEIANSIIDTMLDENLPEFNQSKIDFWLDVKNDLKRVALAVAS